MKYVALLLVAATMATGAESKTPPLPCVPNDTCGCSILVSGGSCPDGGAHLFHELADGAPLQFNLGRGPTTAIPTQAHANIFSHGPGDSWTESYRHGAGTIEIRYTPGANTCPKLAQGEQCEYFDVSVGVLLSDPHGTQTYSGVGTCGC